MHPHLVQALIDGAGLALIYALARILLALLDL